MYKDRAEAASKLIGRLKKYKDTNSVILAIPRGGLGIGAILADALELPLDIILIKKIGHPNNKELAIGAVSLSSRILNQTFKVPQRYIEEETIKIRELLREKNTQYGENRAPIDIEGKNVILVDDGIATGNTMLSAIELCRENKAEKVIVAAPVAPVDTFNKLRKIADAVVIDDTPLNFSAVGQFYIDFPQISDNEAIEILKKTRQSGAV